MSLPHGNRIHRKPNGSATRDMESSQAASGVLFRNVLEACRTYQWSKNLLVFVPAIMAHSLTANSLINFEIFFAFCFCSSAIYIINDIFDAKTDRLDSVKRLRPIAKGTLSEHAGFAVASVLTMLGVTISISADCPEIPLYVCLAISYSLFLRRFVVVDVIALSCFYTLRLLAGFSPGIKYSCWLTAFSVLVFISLALIKRYVELSKSANANGRGYSPKYLPIIGVTGLLSGFLSIFVLAFYVNSEQAESLYRSAYLLSLICPLILFWLIRIWLKAFTGSLCGCPVLFAVRDRMSYCVGIGILLILWLSI
jgi:4-hydroxybenzoate polyprenyltransferase